MNNKYAGIIGEQDACEYLIGKGYKILSRNTRIAGVEIDIISKTSDLIVFCEVKNRENSSFGRAVEAVNTARIKRYVRAGLLFMAKKENANKTLRFDVIEINAGKITHIEDAFRA